MFQDVELIRIHHVQQIREQMVWQTDEGPHTSEGYCRVSRNHPTELFLWFWGILLDGETVGAHLPDVFQDSPKVILDRSTLPSAEPSSSNPLLPL